MAISSSVWASDSSRLERYGFLGRTCVQGQRYASNGAALREASSSVNTFTTTGNQIRASVSLDADWRLRRRAGIATARLERYGFLRCLQRPGAALPPPTGLPNWERVPGQHVHDEPISRRRPIGVPGHRWRLRRGAGLANGSSGTARLGLQHPGPDATTIPLASRTVLRVSGDTSAWSNTINAPVSVGSFPSPRSGGSDATPARQSVVTRCRSPPWKARPSLRRV